MKFIRTIMLCLLVSIINSKLCAQEQVSITEAKRAAINSMKLRMLDNSFDEANIDTVYALKHKIKVYADKVLLYEVLFKNGQAVLLSGNKACKPVLGYYTSNRNISVFDAKNEDVSCCFKNLIEEYIKQIEWSFEQDTVMLYNQKEWEDLQTENSEKSRKFNGYIVVNPLIKSQWGQSKSNDGEDCNAYNYYVSYASNSCKCGIRCPTGCVATAMAQIMNYWKYPVYLPAKSRQFDWCNMPNELNYSSNNYLKERDAIAYLMIECGIKAEMKYCGGGECSSGAYMKNARDALVDDFQYNDDADKQAKLWYTMQTWKNRIKGNLNSGLPVLYSGSGTSAHAFVCDGYTSDDYFHFNFGWRGNDDAWFTVDNIVFTSNGETTNYSSSQEAIFYIRPNYSDNYCSYYLPLWVHYYMYYVIGSNISPPPYMNVPQTFNRLESVPTNNGFPTSWHTISTGQSATYTAHNEIVLKPGFHAQAGCHFIARIEPCAACNTTSFLASNSNTDGILDAEFDDLYFPLQDKQSNNIDNAISNEFNQEAVRIQPNPNNGTFTIQTNFDIEEIENIQVVNLLGNVIFEQNTFNSQISIPNPTAGMYFLIVTLKDKIITRKFVIQ